MNKAVGLLYVLFAAVALTQAQSSAKDSTQAQAASQVPVIDGAAGPCSLALTVLGSDGKPVYNATVKVHIAYGFGGIRKLDLQAGTNADGKVKFTGIPARVHRPPIEFDATKDDLQGSVTFDPLAECHASNDIKLAKPKSQD